MKTGRYLEGQRNRQEVIDYLVANPGAFGPEIISALKLDGVTGAGRLQRMTNFGELRREKGIYVGTDSIGRVYKNASFQYWALVTKTRSQEEVLKSVAQNFNSMKKKKHDSIDHRAGKWVGGSFRNTKQDRPVVKCPDAMSGVGFRGMTQLESMA